MASGLAKAIWQDTVKEARRQGRKRKRWEDIWQDTVKEARRQGRKRKRWEDNIRQ